MTKACCVTNVKCRKSLFFFYLIWYLFKIITHSKYCFFGLQQAAFYLNEQSRTSFFNFNTNCCKWVKSLKGEFEYRLNLNMLYAKHVHILIPFDTIKTRKAQRWTRTCWMRSSWTHLVSAMDSLCLVTRWPNSYPGREGWLWRCAPSQTRCTFTLSTPQETKYMFAYTVRLIAQPK